MRDVLCIYAQPVACAPDTHPYYYTMRAVGGTDELQLAVHKFEDMKNKDAGSS
jgi:hypothetical protein